MVEANDINDGNGGNGGNVVDPLKHTQQNYLTFMVAITIDIMLPDLRESNCELRHGLINMIERMQFHGLLFKDLVLHLKKFLRLTNIMKSPTIASDYIKLVAFSFLLGRKVGD